MQGRGRKLHFDVWKSLRFKVSESSEDHSVLDKDTDTYSVQGSDVIAPVHLFVSFFCGSSISFHFL